MKGALVYAGLLLVVLLGPILLRKHIENPNGQADETLVIISPHNEAIRYEFARAFSAAHFAKTGRRVFVDWRAPGGASEIARYVAAQFLGSFRDDWTRVLHREWTPGCAAFDEPRATGSDAMAARAAFLKSNAGCGVDLFFGGGSFDYMQMAAAGRLVDSGIVAAHPELFGPRIPQTLGGEPLWDPKGCWIGACLGAFGICYNTDSLARLGIATPPLEWAGLADPRYANELALADPTQSGSVAKAFEMILQQQIAEADGDVAKGWLRGMQLIQRISANGRYFTDSATDIPYTVKTGDAAAGMCIDFYGRFESESVRRADGTSRLVYVTPQGGSSTGADSIGLFRGAPHPALAREFMEFVISQQGQKLWCFRAGTPGGPEKYTLRRLPIRPGLYAAQWKRYEADPDVDPYSPGNLAFIYHPAWTGGLFSVISFGIRTAFIDPHDELKEAWQALIDAHFPPRAAALFSDMSAVDYAQASGRIKAALRSPDKLAQVELARELDEHFRDQYRRAAAMAREEPER
ncbi:MAG TPA: extracellular solute-binding protein [Chthoniobacteraceae bacterium]|jgi:ABC-type Fe3+ transport system substrate-binding protein|nr:extracellular solute-binding protein [Chthoniobacteraceae bacterium]